MAFSLQNKVVIITGASSGIGAALAKRCCQRGAKVVLAARSEQRLKELQSEIAYSCGESIFLKTDVTRSDEVNALIQTTLQKWGRLDVLINNAGYGLWGKFDQLPIEEIRKNFETNVFGAIVCMQAVVPHFRKQKKGFIVNVESIVALRAMPLSSVYSATKHALHALSESLRAELAPEGIRVLSVCPGLIQTEFHENRVKYGTNVETGPKWLYMDVERCSQQMIQAIERQRSQIVITGHAKLMAFAQRIAPRLMDWVFSKNYERAIQWSQRYEKQRESTD